MGDETIRTEVAEDEEFSAAAPPHPGAAGTGETSFGDAEAPGASELAAVQSDLHDLTKQRDDYLALAQRTQADFENYRKRMAKETAAAQDRGVKRVVSELLPALDNFERALAAAEAEEADEEHHLTHGIRLVQQELAAALTRVGIEAFSPQGEAFDPNEHEAMAQQPVEGAKAGTVVEVYQAGYKLNGTVVRPARVVVAA
jgi:molecular chaperone GrpE